MNEINASEAENREGLVYQRDRYTDDSKSILAEIQDEAETLRLRTVLLTAKTKRAQLNFSKQFTTIQI